MLQRCCNAKIKVSPRLFLGWILTPARASASCFDEYVGLRLCRELVGRDLLKYRHGRRVYPTGRDLGESNMFLCAQA